MIAQTNSVDEFIIAIPSASSIEMRRIVTLCDDTVQVFLTKLFPELVN